MNHGGAEENAVFEPALNPFFRIEFNIDGQDAIGHQENPAVLEKQKELCKKTIEVLGYTMIGFNIE